MNHNKLTILFLLQRARLNKQGKCPIRCRLTFRQKRKEFATGLFVNPDSWNSKSQKVHPSSEENDFINTQLELISRKINKSFLFLQVNEMNFDTADVYLAYNGENIKKNRSFLEVLELHNRKMEKLVGQEYAPRYYEKWIGTQTLLKRFIRFNYKKSDVLLDTLTMKFLDDLDFYLKSEKYQKQITVNKCIQRVRKIIRLAISESYLERDPFIAYKPKRYEKKIIYLTKEELDKLMSYNFAQGRLKQVNDMFIFCCYTGLAFAEMDALSKEHVIVGFDGAEWIEMYRKKTKSLVSIPLLPIPKGILQTYRGHDNKLLPRISNQKFNSYLKEIAEITGIEKNLTHHIARKTFATTILLYNDIPMEIVSELLGHSNMITTSQSYGKVVQKKVSDHMKKLSEKLK